MLGAESGARHPKTAKVTGVNVTDDSMTKPVVDGFSYSLTRLVTPLSFYQNCVAQLDTLRRANGYHMRVYNVPDDLDEPIAAYGNLEYQVRTQPGAYLWAVQFALTQGSAGSVTNISIQVTDACTESKIFSDYTLGSAFAETTSGVGFNRPPCLLDQPFLIGAPGLVNVEIYNNFNQSITCQLLLFFAEPSLPMGELAKIFQASGYSV